MENINNFSDLDTMSKEFDETKFLKNQCIFEPNIDNNTESEYNEIDFPKLRTIQLPENDIITISVNYEKINDQMRFYLSNNPNLHNIKTN